MDATGALVTRYTHALGIDQPLAIVKSGTTSYYEGDGLGSVTSLSNSSGALASTYAYDSFGRLTAAFGTIANPYRFTGRELDSETDLYYYRARYYDPGIGRFISEDPIGLNGGLNTYRYVYNSPLDLVDPTGMSAVGTVQTVSDVLDFMFGANMYGIGTYHSGDAAAGDLAKTPAMNDIRRKYRGAQCQSGLYCGDFGPKQFLTTWNFTGQAVGGFCAYMTSLGGGSIQVDAFNDWGAASGTRNPTANRNNPSLWDMLAHGAPIKNPSSLWNDWQGGALGKMRVWYHWTEEGPCCGK